MPVFNIKKHFIQSSMVIVWSIAFCVFIKILQIPSFWQNENSLNIFIWPQSIDINILRDFEKKTGIKLYVSYCESNEELFVKIKRTNGLDYDLIIPSDYTVSLLIKENLVKKIDRSKLDFWHLINPSLLNKYYDIENKFSIPLEFSIYGIGFNSDQFKKDEITSWANVFDGDNKVVMPNDIRELILITSQYIFGQQKKTNYEDCNQIISTLKNQKRKIESYTDSRADNILTNKNCNLAVASSLFIAQGMKQNKKMSFVIPKEGSFISIENIAIPIGSHKDNLTYKLINYLFEMDTMIKNTKKLSITPVRQDVFKSIKKNTDTQMIEISDEQIKNAEFFTDKSLTENQIDQVLLELKS